MTFSARAMFPVTVCIALRRIVFKFANELFLTNSRYLSHFCPNRVDHSDSESRVEIQFLARAITILELVRTAVRPFSLSLRLCANLSCRHILMVLANSVMSLSRIRVTVLCRLESLVCVVQAYVFFALWRMYQAE